MKDGRGTAVTEALIQLEGLAACVAIADHYLQLARSHDPPDQLPPDTLRELSNVATTTEHLTTKLLARLAPNVAQSARDVVDLARESARMDLARQSARDHSAEHRPSPPRSVGPHTTQRTGTGALMGPPADPGGFDS